MRSNQAQMICCPVFWLFLKFPSSGCYLDNLDVTAQQNVCPCSTNLESTNRVFVAQLKTKCPLFLFVLVSTSSSPAERGLSGPRNRVSPTLVRRLSDFMFFFSFKRASGEEKLAFCHWVCLKRSGIAQPWSETHNGGGEQPEQQGCKSHLSCTQVCKRGRLLNMKHKFVKWNVQLQLHSPDWEPWRPLESRIQCNHGRTIVWNEDESSLSVTITTHCERFSFSFEYSVFLAASAGPTRQHRQSAERLGAT